MGDLSPTFLLQNFYIKYFLKDIWPSFHLFFHGEASFIHVNWIKNFFSNCDRNMCSVLIFKYVYFEIGPIILDLLIMVNCPYHENVCEFTPWILIAINKEKMKSHLVCIHNLFYEKQLNLAIVINVKWLYHIQSFSK